MEANQAQRTIFRGLTQEENKIANLLMKGVKKLLPSGEPNPEYDPAVAKRRATVRQEKQTRVENLSAGRRGGSVTPATVARREKKHRDWVREQRADPERVSYFARTRHGKRKIPQHAILSPLEEGKAKEYAEGLRRRRGLRDQREEHQLPERLKERIASGTLRKPRYMVGPKQFRSPFKKEDPRYKEPFTDLPKSIWVCGLTKAENKVANRLLKLQR